MFWWVVLFSFLVGFFGRWMFSVVFVLYFSLAAATGIAIMQFYFDRSLATAGLAWLATIFAVQFGFVVSVVVSVTARALGNFATRNREVQDFPKTSRHAPTRRSGHQP